MPKLPPFRGDGARMEQGNEVAKSMAHEARKCQRKEVCARPKSLDRSAHSDASDLLEWRWCRCQNFTTARRWLRPSTGTLLLLSATPHCSTGY